MRLATGLRRPKRIVRGVDMAGIVSQRGSGGHHVRPRRPGVRGQSGAFAECVAVPEGEAVSIPDGIEFADAAAR